jgi:hypothetical protein
LFITTDTVSTIFIQKRKLPWCSYYVLRTALQPPRGRYGSRRRSAFPGEGTTLLSQRCRNFRHLQQGVLATPPSTLDQRRRCVLKN